MAAVTTLKPRGGRRHLRRLGPEPWGQRLARARDEAGWTQRGIAAMFPKGSGYSYGTIQRMEREQAVPVDEPTRGRAYVLVTAYGFDPADFGLDDCDRPALVDWAGLARLAEVGPDLLSSSSRCTLLAA